MRITDRRNKPYMDGETRGLLYGVLGVVGTIALLWGFYMHTDDQDRMREDRSNTENEERYDDFQQARLDLCTNAPEGTSTCLLILEQIDNCKSQKGLEGQRCMEDLAEAREAKVAG
jgi:hypothetical protein